MEIHIISCDDKTIANSDGAILISLTITVNSLSSENIYLHTPIQTDADDREKFCAQKQTTNITFLLASETKHDSFHSIYLVAISKAGKQKRNFTLTVVGWRIRGTHTRGYDLGLDFESYARACVVLKTNSAIHSLVRATLDIELKQLRFKRAPFSHRKVLARIVRWQLLHKQIQPRNATRCSFHRHCILYMMMIIMVIKIPFGERKSRTQHGILQALRHSIN